MPGRHASRYGRAAAGATTCLGSLLFGACAAPAPGPSEAAKLVTTDALPIGRGRVELELAYSRGRVDEEFDSSGNPVDRVPSTVQVGTLTTTVGLTDALDGALAVGVTGAVENDADDLPQAAGSFVMGLRWRLYSSDDGALAVAWVPMISSPEAAKGASAVAVVRDYWSLDNLLAVTWVPGRFNASADVGYVLPLEDQNFVSPSPGGLLLDSEGTVVLDVAAGWQWTAVLQPIAELNYAHDVLRGGKDAYLLAGTFGVVLSISSRFRLDLGVQQGLDGRDRGRATTVLLNASLTL